MACPPVLSETDLVYFRTKPCLRPEIDTPEKNSEYVFCRFGAKCQYSHNKVWKRRCPYFLKSWIPERSLRYLPLWCPEVSFCVRHRNGQMSSEFNSAMGEMVVKGVHCERGDNCPFAHTFEEVIYHPLAYKRIQCETIKRKQVVKKNSKGWRYSGRIHHERFCQAYYCSNAHDSKELRDPQIFHIPFCPGWIEEPDQMPFLPGVIPLAAGTVPLDYDSILETCKTSTSPLRTFVACLLAKDCSGEAPFAVAQPAALDWIKTLSAAGISQAVASLFVVDIDRAVVVLKHFAPEGVKPKLQVGTSPTGRLPDESLSLHRVMPVTVGEGVVVRAFGKASDGEDWIYGVCVSGPHKGDEGWLPLTVIHQTPPHMLEDLIEPLRSGVLSKRGSSSTNISTRANPSYESIALTDSFDSVPSDSTALLDEQLDMLRFLPRYNDSSKMVDDLITSILNEVAAGASE
ncbi:MAG: uncharacterized protein KVP18_000623 [Porospora cf. gigantea A]|uniref:uncharacterized protein n=2 Tax=Porospora cf. gigantea A TaxID=2853593 RepID=UPI00355AB263|nr:MAG: hypothetical protein KVP18_000623 [Porospora cf. gigantea A]